MGNKIEVLLAQGLDVPNFFNDVPNFVKNVPKGPKFVSKKGTTSNHFLRLSNEINEPWEGS